MQLRSQDIKKLLERAEYNTKYTDQAKQWWIEYGHPVPDTLFKKPATAKEIQKLEERLAITLPEDYKEFLSVTNGFGAEHGIDDGIFNGICPEPELCSSDKVEWLSEEHFQLPIELFYLPYDIQDLADKHSDFGNGRLPCFDRVLHIGQRDIDSLWLVTPEQLERARGAYLQILERASDEQRPVVEKAIVKFAGSMEAFKEMEWAMVKWSSGGAACMQGYAGFRDYLKRIVDDGSRDRNVDAE